MVDACDSNVIFILLLGCLQLSRKAPIDGEFQEVTTGRHFWQQWLHGNKRNKPQDKAAAAADARAKATQLKTHNRFDLLGQVGLFVIAISLCILLT